VDRGAIRQLRSIPATTEVSTRLAELTGLLGDVHERSRGLSGEQSEAARALAEAQASLAQLDVDRELGREVPGDRKRLETGVVKATTTIDALAARQRALDTAERLAENDVRAFAQANDAALSGEMNAEALEVTAAMVRHVEAALEEYERVRQLGLARGNLWLGLVGRGHEHLVNEHTMEQVDRALRSIAALPPEDLAPLLPAPLVPEVIEVEMSEEAPAA
jgi:hypothetical protein